MNKMSDEVVTQLQAKLYLDRYPHLYDEILIRAIAEDNQFLVLEIAKRYGLPSDCISGLQKKSTEALIAYMIDCGIAIHTASDKLAMIGNVLGNQTRRISYDRKSIIDVTYMNLSRIPGDVMREILTYLDPGDQKSLQMTSWNMLIHFSDRAPIFRILQCGYRQFILPEKQDIPCTELRILRLFRTEVICKCILPSIKLNASHILTIAQLDISPKNMAKMIEYLASNESDLILSMAPLNASYSIRSLASVAMLLLIAPTFRNIKDLISHKLLIRDQFIMDIISRVHYENWHAVNIIAHAIIDANPSYKMTSRELMCYKCGVNCIICKMIK